MEFDDSDDAVLVPVEGALEENKRLRVAIFLLFALGVLAGLLNHSFIPVLIPVPFTVYLCFHNETFAIGLDVERKRIFVMMVNDVTGRKKARMVPYTQVLKVETKRKKENPRRVLKLMLMNGKRVNLGQYLPPDAEKIKGIITERIL
ncbi:MAG: hypothetical protein ACFFCS_02100 [Candidatus Hodarchaeota archaeon]